MPVPRLCDIPPRAACAPRQHQQSHARQTYIISYTSSPCLLPQPSLCSPAVLTPLSHCPVLHSDVPNPIQPLPTASAPWWQGGTGGTGGRAALVAPSWLGVSAHFISFPSTCQATENVPPSPAASCVTWVSPGPSGRQAGPAAGSAQASSDAKRHQASPGSGSHLRFGVYGVLPSMPTCSRACGAQQGRGSWALVAHPLPLSPGMTPSISMLHGKAGGNV